MVVDGKLIGKEMEIGIAGIPHWKSEKETRQNEHIQEMKIQMVNISLFLAARK